MRGRTPSTQPRPGPRGVGLGVVDQALSSASNVIMVLGVARTSGVEQFGRIALLLLVMSTALAGARGAIGTPLLLTGGQKGAGYRRESGGGVAAAAVIGVVGGIVVLGIGAAIGTLTEALVIAFALPAVLVQDVCRYSALARGNQMKAVRWDAVWAVGTVTVLAITWVSPDALSASEVLGIWGVLALVSAFGLMRGQSVVVRWGLFIDWVTHERSHRARYGAEGVIGALTALLVVASASALLGADAAAALRGAGTLLGPLSVVMAAVPLAVVPDVSRTGLSAEETWHRLRRVAIALSTLALIVGGVATVLPDSVGRLLLGDTWAVASPLLPLTGLEYAGLAWVSVTYTYLRAQGRSTALLWGRCVHSVVSLGLAAAAAAIWGTAYAVAGALAVTAFSVALLMRQIAGLGHKLRPS